KVLWWTATLRPTDSGQYGFNHLLAQDQQRRERADAWSAHPVPPRFTDPLHKRLAPQLVQVISCLSICITGHRPSFLSSHSLSQFCGSEALGLCPQRDYRFSYRSHPWLLQVHARHAPHAPHTRRSQSIQLLAVHKAQVCRLHDTQKCHHHRLQAFQHARQFLQPLATTQLLDVVDDDLTRSTRSPLSYIFRFSLPKCSLNTVRSYTERSMIFSNRPSRA